MNLLSFEIFTLELEEQDNLLYIIKDKKSRKSFVLDPAWDGKKIIKTLKEKDCDLVGIILTHSHYDHINAIDEILAYRSVPVHINKQERNFWGREDLNFIDYEKDGEIISLGETEFVVYHFPGHSIGSMAIYSQRQLFLGDTLFVYGCGHCRLPSANAQELYKSLQRIKKNFTDEVIIYSGHDYGITRTSTIGEQKKGNPFLLIENEQEFVDYRMFKHNRLIPYSAVDSI